MPQRWRISDTEEVSGGDDVLVQRVPTLLCSASFQKRQWHSLSRTSDGSMHENNRYIGTYVSAFPLPLGARSSPVGCTQLELITLKDGRLRRRRYFVANGSASSLAHTLARTGTGGRGVVSSGATGERSPRGSDTAPGRRSNSVTSIGGLRRWWGNAQEVDKLAMFRMPSCGKLSDALMSPFLETSSTEASGTDNRLRALVDVLEAVAEQVLNSNEDVGLAPLVSSLRNACRDLLSADLASLFLRIEEHGEEFLWSVLDNGSEVKLSINEGLAGACARSKDTISVSDAYEDSRFHQNIDSATGYRTRGVMCVPVLGSSNDEVLGVLQVVNKRQSKRHGNSHDASASQAEGDRQADSSYINGNIAKEEANQHVSSANPYHSNMAESELISGFDQADERILKGFAFLAAMAISSAQHLEAERKAKARYDSLARLSQHLLSNLDLRAIQAAIYKEAPQLVSADRAHLLLLDAAGGFLWTHVHEEPTVLPLFTDEPRPQHASLLATVVMEERMATIEDAAASTEFRRDVSLRLGLDGMQNKTKSSSFGMWYHNNDVTTGREVPAHVQKSRDASVSEGDVTPEFADTGSPSVQEASFDHAASSAPKSAKGEDSQTDGCSQHFSVTQPHAVIACPVFKTRERGALGVLMACRDGEQSVPFDQEDIELYQALARYTASAVSNAAAFASASGTPHTLSVREDKFFPRSHSPRSAEIVSASPSSLAVPRIDKRSQEGSQGSCGACDTDKQEESISSIIERAALAELDDAPNECILRGKWGDGAISWDFNPLQHGWMENELRDLCVDIVCSWGLEQAFRMPENSLESFIGEVASHYKSNQFHNFAHAASVMQASHMMLKELDARSRRKFARVDALVLLLGAVVHDVGHPGTTNTFQTNSLSPLAVKYNDCSVLENHHCSLAFELLLKAGCNVLMCTPRSIFKRFRRSMCAAILATDLACHEKQLVQLTTNVPSPKTLCKTDSDKDVLLSALLHAADLSNPARPFDVSKRWAKLLAAEFQEQAKLERELALPVAKFMEAGFSINNEIFFVSGFCLPFWEALASAVPGLCTALARVRHTLQELREIASEEEQQTE